MTVYTFDGSQNLTINDFNADTDLVVIENLETADVSEVRNSAAGAQVVLFSGVVLTFAGRELADLEDATFFPFGSAQIGGDDQDYLGVYNESGAEGIGGVLVGLEGNDNLSGEDGDDLIFGNEDDDNIYGNGGNDRLYGGQGDDNIFVGAEDTQNDSVVVYGGLGEDEVYVSGSNGFEGDVTVYGGNGVDSADDEDDSINLALASSATAVIYGNGGDDSISINASYGGEDGFGVGGDVTVYGGQGDDNINIGNGDFEGGFNGFVDSAVVYGGLDSDNIFVNAYETTIYGGSGVQDSADSDDIINVLADTAVVYGNGGDDVIGVNAFESTVYGGAGDDEITMYGGDSTLVFGGTGEDSITLNGVDDATVYGGNGMADAADGDDVITINTGGDSHFDVYGNGGDDTITVGVLGQDGPDSAIYGGAGDDTITVGGSEVTVVGGLGEDNITVNAADDVLVYGGNSVASADDGADIINVTLTGDSNAVIYGNGGDDTITVNGGDDVLVFGGQGDDTITFSAEAGDTTVWGNVGADTFDVTFNGAAEPEDERDVAHIADLNFGEDHLDVGATINFVNDITDATTTDANQAAFDAIEDAATLDEAANAALLFGTGTVTLGNAVVFEYDGHTYLTIDTANDDTNDGIVEITGFNGTISTSDFLVTT